MFQSLALSSFDLLGFGCCSCAKREQVVPAETIEFHSQSHYNSYDMKRPSLARGDSLDVTRAPHSLSNRPPGFVLPITLHQCSLWDQLQLPELPAYPVPPGCSENESEADRTRKLQTLYKDFALELHSGVYLSQLTSINDCSDIHCQLMDDLHTLKLDQSNGRIIEFPLHGVSKVYRIIKSSETRCLPASNLLPSSSGHTEHIIVVEFMRRKLAFVFNEMHISERFLIGMELLIRRAQQNRNM